MIVTVSTKPFDGQKTGTSGLRKKTSVMMQPNYVENFVQSIFNAVGGVAGKTFLLGGDGRFFNDRAIQTILKMAAANGMKKIMIGQNGILSTPSASNIIRKYKTDGGIILTASHNPAGLNGDVGIKINSANGGSCSDAISAKIYEQTLQIAAYKTLEAADVDVAQIGKQMLFGMEIEVLDSMQDYIELMQSMFDFAAIKKLFASGFAMKFDSMHAVTGPYAKKIFEELLGAGQGTVINGTPLPDFGGGHPEPNLTYAKDLADIMFSDTAPDFGAASDGDGDRNLILGHNFFVPPSDSLAIITDNFQYIPAYKNGILGVAKSMSTSMAVIRVAKAKNLPHFETPTGWKYFGNLMDAGLITFCGEESYGTGSNHIREKDGIWAALCWLSILAETGKSVKQITEEHWQKYGRSYYAIYNFDGIEQTIADKLIADLGERLPSLSGQKFGNYVVEKAEKFEYHDPVSGETAKNGMRILFADQSRIVCRLSGTGSGAATLRVYLEKFEKDKLLENTDFMLKDLFGIAMQVIEIESRTGKNYPDVIA